ncbi:hypothetical protein B0H67DRAFT_638782 [Lasiosphaeris hirsuta]|uniref:Uncharacterized protein n=1 Tax=Lasiosphaeris hirsuta TaxID=260670 RepID=A0AA40ECF1_9PEZI|nr:hypothetical protein B0H67DRAFT_638782 [Lasiosphaeris hirsuta]
MLVPLDLGVLDARTVKLALVAWVLVLGLKGLTTLDWTGTELVIEANVEMVSIEETIIDIDCEEGGAENVEMINDELGVASVAGVTDIIGDGGLVGVEDIDEIVDAGVDDIDENDDVVVDVEDANVITDAGVDGVVGDEGAEVANREDEAIDEADLMADVETSEELVDLGISDTEIDEEVIVDAGDEKELNVGVEEACDADDVLETMDDDVGV